MDKKTIILLAVVISFLQGCLQQSEATVSTCECSIILDPEFKGTLDVFDAPNGRVLKAVGHNQADEDFIFLELRKSTDQYFEVSVHFSLEGHIVDGWVRKSDVLGIYSRAYNSTDTFELFDTSDTGSQKPIVVMEYSQELLPVIDCDSNGWLKVRYSMNEKVYEGWLPKEAQCANPYTPCN